MQAAATQRTHAPSFQESRQLPHLEGARGCGVHVVSRRMVRPFTPPTVNGSNGCHPPTVSGNGCHRPKEEEDAEVIHLTPWDLRLISIDYIQKGILLPKPPSSVGDNDNGLLVDALESSFARALHLFYPFAGRLASEERDDGTVSVFLRCTGEGAEFVHAVAPDVAVAEIVSSLYTPPVVRKFYPLEPVLGVDAAVKGLPLLAVQVTMLSDGVFIGMALNPTIGDDTTFWHFFNTWSAINRVGGDLLGDLSTPPPVLDWWFPKTCPMPVPMAFRKLLTLPPQVWRALRNCVNKNAQYDGQMGGAAAAESSRSIVGNGLVLEEFSMPAAPVLQRWFLDSCKVPIGMPCFKIEYVPEKLEPKPVKECFFTFSAESVNKLKAQANGEMSGRAMATISSLQAVLAHFWRAVCRARRLPPEHGTFYSVVVGCRGRVNGVPAGYVGNAWVFRKAEATAGEIEEKGLGWTAWLLNRAVASFDEASMRESLEQWVREPDFTYMGRLSSGGTALVMASSPDFDVFGNDFGWGKPLAVRSGSGNKVDGMVTVFEGPERGGSISLEVCIAPDALERLVADQEFMDAVSTPAAW